jgi:ankyrin repeat protein
MLHVNPELEVGERFDSMEMAELILRYQPDLLRRTPDPKAWWDNGTPPTPDHARWLIGKGYDPNRRNWLGITTLHRCAAKGRRDIAEVFLQHGADINAIESEWCSTPLGWAAKEGQTEMMDWLISKGADPNLPLDEPWARPAEWIRRRASSAS